MHGNAALHAAVLELLLRGTYDRVRLNHAVSRGAQKEVPKHPRWPAKLGNPDMIDKEVDRVTRARGVLLTPYTVN